MNKSPMMKALGGIFGSSEKRLKLIFALGTAGIALIVLSDFLPQKNARRETVSAVSEAVSETESYRAALEKELAETLSQIEGAGETRVMISLSAAREYVYAEKSDIDRRSGSGDESLKSRGEPVLNGQSPLVRTVLEPKLRGAAIICEGAADPVIRERILDTAAALLGLPTSAISVQPLGTSEKISR